METRTDLTAFAAKIGEVRKRIADVVVGQTEAVDMLLTCIIADGHVLLEGVPGVAKTLLARLMSRLIDARFSRIQFTPDLMPSDVLGTSVFNMKTQEFSFHPGPAFADIILADEINRAPAKTQAALFEVMEERQATIDGTSYKMGDVYTIIATQNPIEQEGTYRLPEAQLDRFLFKVNVGYPTPEQEVQIIKNQHQLKVDDKTEQVQPVLTAEELKKYQTLIKDIIVEENLLEYIARIVVNTRENPFLYLGASPRASLALLTASKGFAAINGRDFVTPDDIKEAAVAVLRHRVIVTPEREMEGLGVEEVIKQILESIEIPR